MVVPWSNRANIPLVYAALAIATLAVYWEVAGHEFVSWDDGLYVYENPHVLSGLTWNNFLWSLGIHGPGQWHPLVWWSHQLDCDLFGLEAGPHHLVNVALHVAATLALLTAFWRLTGDLWPSALVAALFALHPLSVESAAWVSERRDTLSTLFWGLVMWSYAGYARRGGSARYLLVLLLFMLGLMAKPMLVTLPCVLLLLDYWPLRRIRFGAWSMEHGAGSTEHGVAGGAPTNPRLLWLLLEKVPLFALSCASAWLSYLCQEVMGVVVTVQERPLGLRLANAAQSYVLYVGNMFWPVKLSPIYPFPSSFDTRQVAGAVVLLVAITAAAIYFGRRRGYLMVGWLWYLGTLVPVIGLLKMGVDVSMADRWVYVPRVGIFLALAWTLAELVHRRPAVRPAVIGVVAAVLLVLLPLTRRQVAVWRDNQRLYEHALAVTRNNYMAHNNLGGALLVLGRAEEAIAHSQEALRIKPDYAEAHYNWGFALQYIRRFEEAITHYQETLRIQPDYAPAHNNWGGALQALGHPGEAMAHYQEAVRIKPDYAEAHYNWGVALHNIGRVEEAMEHYQEALRVKPDYAPAHNNWGGALQALGRPEEAMAHYQEAVRIKPDYAGAHNNWGLALQNIGRIEEAVAHYQQALRIKPDYAEAQRNLGAALQVLGRPEEQRR